MPYRLSFTDDLPGSVRACAREQLAGAVERLEGAERDPVIAIHEARKHLKKTRALLRLVRPALGKRAYRAENDALRDAGLALSATRDADVLVATVATLADRAAGRLPAALFDAARDALTAAAERSRDGDAGVAATTLPGVIEALRAVGLRMETWPLEQADWETLLAGLSRAYSRGQEAFAVARKTPEPELLHAWRKRAKDLWYHQRLLTPAWPGAISAQAQEAHRLSELLGEDHDLAVLAARLADDAPPLAPAVDARRAELRALIAHRSEELRVDAVRLGRRVYAESPKAFSRRMGRYVELAVAEQRPAGR